MKHTTKKKKLPNYFKTNYLQYFFLNWFNYFRPNLFVPNLLELNIDAIVGHKIRMVILDLDNTLAPSFAKKPTSYALNFIKKLKQKNLIVVIASNNLKKRVSVFCDHIEELNDYIWLAFKPFSYKIKEVMKKYHISPEQTVIIGDQFITDIWAANILKTKSILVTSLFDITINPAIKKNTVKHLIEKYIYTLLQKRNMINQSDLSNIILGTNDEIL